MLVFDVYKQVVETCKQELLNENITFDKNLQVGVMIEIPSIAMVSEEVAQVVDFASIGTNDLTQYLMAVDRMDASLADHYQSYSPALFRVLKMIAEAFNKYQKPISVCGELGGDPDAVGILIGLGINKFSMSVSQITKVQKRISESKYADYKKLADLVLKASTQQEVKKHIDSFNQKN